MAIYEEWPAIKSDQPKRVASQKGWPVGRGDIYKIIFLNMTGDAFAFVICLAKVRFACNGR
jgi:hypothetical protein